jgi:hypothetical protein
MQKDQITEDVFIEALKERKKILLTYLNKEQTFFITKTCVPLQHVQPLSENGQGYYYFWDEHADIGDRLFGLPSSDIKYIEMTSETYNPNDYIVPNTCDI